MNVEEFISLTEDEKPLDRMVTNGGYCGIFDTIGCIGDSLSSGEFESFDAEGNMMWHDMFEYSWGQYIARNCGIKVYNFSRGGMTASEYMNSFAQQQGFWDTDKLCKAYIIALGENDMFGQRRGVGSVEDINCDDYTKNADTFAGDYARIIQRLKSMQPDAYFFLMTMPRGGEAEVNLIRQEHAKLLENMTKVFSRTYLIDLYKYAPVYDDEFRKRFFLGGHMNPAGYMFSARIIESYIDYIIRHNAQDFCESMFVGTPFSYNKR